MLTALVKNKNITTTGDRREKQASYQKGEPLLRGYPLTALLAFGLLFSLTQTIRGETERSFAIVPQHSAITLAEQWQPLIQELGNQTGLRLRFVTAPTVAEFERRLLNGDYDYVYLNAAVFLEAKKLLGYRSLAQRQKSLKGIIVVRQDGPTLLRQLAGKTIAFPSPRAFGATLLTRAELKRSAIRHNVAYLGTHESAYRAVARGQFVAAGGVLRSFNTLPDEVKSALRVIHTTASAPPHIIAVSKNITIRESSKVRKALRALNKHRLGRETLSRLKFSKFVAPDQQKLRQLTTLNYPARRKTRAIIFHVIPRLDERSTRDQMQPLAAYLKRRLEVQINLNTHATMGDFEKSIYAERQPALINANPVQAIRLAKKGYSIIAQQLPVKSPEGMRGIIIVREDSSIKNIMDLKGKRIAFGGNKNAFFASIVPKVLLIRKGLAGKYNDVSEPGPVSDVIKRLRAGEIDAAGSGTMALHSRTLQNKYSVHKMRVIAESEPMPGLAWLLSNSVDADLRDEIKGLLLAYSSDAPGHAALRAGGISGMQPARLRDYSGVSKYLDELH